MTEVEKREQAQKEWNEKFQQKLASFEHPSQFEIEDAESAFGEPAKNFYDTLIGESRKIIAEETTGRSYNNI